MGEIEAIEINGVILRLKTGDITLEAADAIINAANPSLMGGGGVDGAIHRAGGPAILAECRRIVAEQGQLPTGKAVLTGGGRLPARYVIHTVGPVWQGGGQGEATALASAYTESLSLAIQHNLETVAFPSISTGAYGYPVAEAARLALSTVGALLRRTPGNLKIVTFVLFDARTRERYREALRMIENPAG